MVGNLDIAPPVGLDEINLLEIQPEASFGEAFHAAAAEGVMQSFGLGTVLRQIRTPGSFLREGPGNPFGPPPEPVQVLTESQYKASPFFREEIPFDEGMTLDRAAALASIADARHARQQILAGRPITAFFGMLAGQALDPINYIPVFGPGTRLAGAGRAGAIAGVRAAGLAARAQAAGAAAARTFRQPGAIGSVTAVNNLLGGPIRGRAAVGSLDAAGNTAVFGALTASQREAFGDETGIEALLFEVGTAALIGAVFGGAVGVADRTRIHREMTALAKAEEAHFTLNEAIGTQVETERVQIRQETADAVQTIRAETQRSFVDDTADDLSATTQPVDVAKTETDLGQKVIRETSDTLENIPRNKALGLKDNIWGLLGRVAKQADERDLLNVTEQQAFVMTSDGRVWQLKRQTHDDFFNSLRQGAPDAANDALAKAANIALFRLSQGPAGVSGGFDFYATPSSRQARAFRRIKQTLGADRDDLFSVSLWDSPVDPNVAPKAETGKDLTPAIETSGKADTTPEEDIPFDPATLDAERAIGKPAKDFADEFDIDPNSLEVPELDDVAALKEQGRLSAGDERALTRTEEIIEKTKTYNDALKFAGICEL